MGFTRAHPTELKLMETVMPNPTARAARKIGSSPNLPGLETDLLDEPFATALSQGVEGSATARPRASSIAFIDPHVANYQELAASFDASVEVVVLDVGVDGVQQIAAWLQGRSGIETVHIVSHGGEASLQLGSATLSSSTLPSYRQLLSGIGAALSNDADILLYGCNVASGPEGQAFIEQLAMLTGADVAASNDPTGASRLGGDANLEVSFGDVTANSLLDQPTVDSLGLILLVPPSTINPTVIFPGSSGWIWTNQNGDYPATLWNIGSSAEIDYYRFFADATGTFTISVGGGTLDSILRVYDSNGNSIAGPIDNLTNPSATEIATPPLTENNWYYIAVGGYQTSIGTYNLSINGPTPTINVISTPAPNYIGGFVNGGINPAGDIDWFKLTAPAGTTSLNISVQPSPGLNTIVQLLNSSGTPVLGNVIDNPVAGGLDAANNISIAAEAIFYVGVTSLGSGTYDFNADFGPNQSLPVLSIAVLSADKAEGSSGGTTPFTFTVTRGSGDTSGTTTVNWTVQALASPDANGTDFVGGSFPSGITTFIPNDLSETITVNVQADTLYESNGLGELFFVTLSNPSGGANINPLQASAQGRIQNDDPDPSLDPNDQISEAQALGAMTIDRAVTGTIDVGTDVDMFSFSVTAGQRIAFDLDRPSGSLDSYFRLFDSSGGQLDFNNNGSAPNELFSTTDSWLQHTFNSGGTYYVGVQTLATPRTTPRPALATGPGARAHTDSIFR